MGGTMSGAVVSSVLSMVSGKKSSGRAGEMEERQKKREQEKSAEEARRRRKERMRVHEARNIEAAQLKKKGPETLVNGGTGLQGPASTAGAALKSRLGE